MIEYVNHVDIKKKRTLYENMKARCYSKSYQKGNPAYKGCTVCAEWLDDRQAFYDWVDRNYYLCKSEQVDLDKDILVKGNREYSPATCIFVPHSINTFYEKLTREPVYLPESDKWKISINVEGKLINLGYYNSPNEAKKVYIQHKEASLLAKADLYKDKIPEKLYNAMVNTKIELSDWKK